jgi:hypothetical protein
MQASLAKHESVVWLMSFWIRVPAARDQAGEERPSSAAGMRECRYANLSERGLARRLDWLAGGNAMRALSNRSVYKSFPEGKLPPRGNVITNRMRRMSKRRQKIELLRQARLIAQAVDLNEPAPESTGAAMDASVTAAPAAPDSRPASAKR